MMEATYHVNSDNQMGNMFNTYLFKNGEVGPNRVDLTMSVPSTVTTSVSSYLPNTNFHAPNFGEEDFDLPPISVPSIIQQVSQSNHFTRPLSHPPTSIPNSNLTLNQPLSHPTSSATCSISNGLQNSHSLIPKFPPQFIDIPDISLSNSVLVDNNLNVSLSMMANSPTYGENIMNTQMSLRSQQPLSTINQSQLALQNNNRQQPAGQYTSPPGSNNTSPGRESSEDSDDSLPLAQIPLILRSLASHQPLGITSHKDSLPGRPGGKLLSHNALGSGICVHPVINLALKRTAPASVDAPAAGSSTKKPKTPKKKKKKDPNEPQKPVSAYALFFRDTQGAIKGQNPNASFGEVSKIVASMWDGLDEEHKNNYKKKTEAAKKEYLKQLAAYRASLVSKQTAMEQAEPFDAAKMQSQKPLLPNMMNQGNMVNIMPKSSPPHQSAMGMAQGPQQPGMLQHHPLPNIVPRPSTDPQVTIATTAASISMNNQNFMAPGLQQQDVNNMNNANLQCVRNGCHNSAIENPGWDHEFCSNECVVNHCRDVFTAWVASRQSSDAFASVK